MVACESIHREYDKLANKELQLGSLPDWMHVKGPVAWYVFQGPYSRLPEGWGEFMRRAHQLTTAKLAGPPGDVYICDPMEHKADNGEKLITILWAPLKD